MIKGILIVYISGMLLYYCIMTIMDIHVDYSKYDLRGSADGHVYLTKKALSKYSQFIEGEQY